MKENNKKNKNSSASQKTDHLQKGKAAIKAHQDIVERRKPQEQKDKEEERDAEKWHNEG